MSGGSFGYAYQLFESFEFDNLIQIKSVEAFLREEGKIDAADEVHRMIVTMESMAQSINHLGTQMSPVLHAAEWWASNDYAEDQFDEQWELYKEKGVGK